MKGQKFPKGSIVKLTEAAVQVLYGAHGIYRSIGLARRYRVVGYSRDGRCTWISNIEGSAKSRESYYTGYLERAQETGK